MGSSHAGQESRAILVTVVTSCMLNEKNVIKWIPLSRASRQSLEFENYTYERHLLNAARQFLCIPHTSITSLCSPQFFIAVSTRRTRETWLMSWNMELDSRYHIFYWAGCLFWLLRRCRPSDPHTFDPRILAHRTASWRKRVIWEARRSWSSSK